MEGIEKAVPSVQLTKRLICYIDDVLRLEGIEKTKELQQFSTAKEGSSIPFHLVRHVFQKLKDAGILLLTITIYMSRVILDACVAHGIHKFHGRLNHFRGLFLTYCLISLPLFLFLQHAVRR